MTTCCMLSSYDILGCTSCMILARNYMHRLRAHKHCSASDEPLERRKVRFFRWPERGFPFDCVPETSPTLQLDYVLHRTVDSNLKMDDENTGAEAFAAGTQLITPLFINTSALFNLCSCPFGGHLLGTCRTSSPILTLFVKSTAILSIWRSSVGRLLAGLHKSSLA